MIVYADFDLEVYVVSSKQKISVRCIDDVWWLISPEGTPFISLGINHVDPLFLTGPYNMQRTVEVYGDDLVDAQGHFNYTGEAYVGWLSQVEKDFDEWGVNSYGYYTEIPHETISSKHYYIKRINIVSARFYEDFPDVFTDSFAELVDNRVSSACLECSEDANLLGYAFTDIATLEKSMRKSIRIPETFRKKSSKLFASLLRSQIEKENERCDPIHPCVTTFSALPESAPGKKQWIDVLKANYLTPSKANVVYQVNAKTWHDFETTVVWPEATDKLRARKDNFDMLTRIAERYYFLMHQAVRKYDPSHLIFGDKQNGNNEVPEYLLLILKKYVDVILIDWDERFENQRDTFEHIHNATGVTRRSRHQGKAGVCQRVFIG